MIGVIDKGNSFKGLIDYNEKKVDLGTAEFIMNSTLGINGESFNKDFMATCKAKPKIKDKAVQIILSFSKEDKIDNTKMVELSTEYLKGMGYGDSPFLVYRHFDTEHDHLHIITSRVDYSGKLVSSHKDFHRSLELCRLMEEAHGLHKVVYRSGTDKGVSEINANRYSFQNGLRKALNDPSASVTVEPLVLTELVELFKQGQSISNSKALAAYEKKGLKQGFIKLNDFLLEKGFIVPLQKDLLVDRLTAIKKSSLNFEDFIFKAQEQGLYVRVLESKKQIVLGIKEKSFYLKDKQLPRPLRYMSLIAIGQRAEVSEKQQMNYIAFHVRQSLKHSYRLEDFTNKLRMKGIETSVKQDARGIYGFSFRNDTVEGSATFKASELGVRKEFSVEKIISALSKNAAAYPSKAKQEYKQFVPTNYPVDLKRLAKSIDEEDHDEEALKKSRGYGA